MSELLMACDEHGVAISAPEETVLYRFVDMGKTPLHLQK